MLNNFHTKMSNPTSTPPLTAWLDKKRNSVSASNELQEDSNAPPGNNVERKSVSDKRKEDTHVEFSTPGLAKVFDENNSACLRFFWFSVLSVCTGICFFQLSDRLQTYFKHHTTLDIAVRRNQTIQFPAMTICPPLKNGTSNFGKIIENKLCQKNKTRSCQEKYDPNIDYIYQDLNTTSEEISDEILMMKEEEVNAMVPTGIFGKQDDFTRFNADYTNIRTFWGNCLVITPKSPIEYRGPYTYVRIRIKSDGATFFLHNEGINQRHDAYFLAEALNGRQYSNIRLSRKEYNFLNTAKRPCVSEKEVVTCRNDCMDQGLDKVLNCSIPYLIYSKLPKCQSSFETMKTFFAIQEFYAAMKSGDCECKRKCKETLFSITTDVINHLNSNETHFNLYYPDNLHEIINELYSYSFSALLSDIGGSLGFYLGLCLVTLVEILEVMLRKILDYLHCRLN